MEMVYGTAGTVILDAASLFLLCGILFYTSLYRKRGRLDDKLFSVMIVVNIIYAFVEWMSYGQEGMKVSFLHGLMIVENTVIYAVMVLFPYLFLLYTDFRVFRDEHQLIRDGKLYGIPCLVWLVMLAVNLKTGWIFAINESNQFIDGPVDEIVIIPMLLYVVITLFLVYRIDISLVFLGLLLAIVRILLGVWFRAIDSTSFFFALYLVFAHIHVMNQPLMEEKP